MTRTCLHCGAVLPSNVRICSFCESTLPVTGGNFIRSNLDGETAWRSELSERLAYYRAKRRRSSPNEDQSQFTFEAEHRSAEPPRQVAVAEAYDDAAASDFAFTIAIGRSVPSKQKQDGQMFIDVSLPPDEATGETTTGERSSDAAEEPAPRNLLLRAAGYMLSAGTFFLGFLWSMWDEDELTWHDRISHTYLRSAGRLADNEIHGAVEGHS